MAAGDFERDVELNPAVASLGSNTFSHPLTRGTGNFALASFPAAGGFSSSVADGDGPADHVARP